MNTKQFKSILDQHPYPLLFVTVSGAHLYGFASADSDYDLRGVHILPLPEVVGLTAQKDTIEASSSQNGREVDFVTHDVHKFFGMMLQRNGYVLEQLLSPIIVHTTPHHDRLKEIAGACITRHHAHHYFGFARSQWGLFEKQRRVKPLLYTYRVLLTGIYLMQTGEVEANLTHLNERFRLPYISDLIARKVAGAENAVLEEADFAFHRLEFERLRSVLESVKNASSLPDKPRCRDELNELLLQIRLA